MDNSNAQLIEFSDTAKETKTVLSNFSLQDRDETLQRSESEMHNKEQQRQRAYFKQLATFILDFGDVLIFGPTDAKTELLHFLRQDHKFEDIDIKILTTDNLTEHKQHTFVKDYFNRFNIITR